MGGRASICCWVSHHSMLTAFLSQICVTRKEWETFADKFNTSKNRNERALRDLIKTEILPQVISTIQVRYI